MLSWGIRRSVQKTFQMDLYKHYPYLFWRHCWHQPRWVGKAKFPRGGWERWRGLLLIYAILGVCCEPPQQGGRGALLSWKWHVAFELPPPCDQLFLQDLHKYLPFLITPHSVVDIKEIAADNLFISSLRTCYQWRFFYPLGVRGATHAKRYHGQKIK